MAQEYTVGCVDCDYFHNSPSREMAIGALRDHKRRNPFHGAFVRTPDGATLSAHG